MQIEILHPAGMILMGGDDITGATAKLQEAVSANARYNTLHVHR